ncbi:hypothetical protein C2G38_2179761 [Gigaspora rosea]|uniref:Uncharacterized protein n=1 Tax=Gigaspora rosea TaxID=44941 RepID=A0A397VCQ9_9GLOM|nr:hypothetical protein C2G38_2179761 [Gigaspora rosea]
MTITSKSRFRKSCSFSLLKFQFELNRKSEELSSGIKEIFQANPHIEHANGTEEQCLDYCGKDFDHCKNLLHNPNPKKDEKCKCDFFDLTKRCKFCNENCEKLFARISEDPNIAGPFVFIYNESKFKNQKEDNDNDDDAYLEAVSDILNGKDVNETIVKFAPKCKKWAYTPQGKSEICKDLFPGIYEKADNKWWEKYNDEEFNYNRDTLILLDDFYGSCSWTNLLKLRKNNSSIDIDAFIRRVKFIIKYEGESIDESGKGDIIRIFEKGNKKEFNERIFDIEFNKGTTLEERQSWDNIINKYSIIEDIDNKTNRVVTNIPKSDPGDRILVLSSEKEKKIKHIKTLKKNQQLEIQQNYQKSLKAKENIVENNADDYDMYEDIELDISEETIHEEFNRKNKNNSLYLGFKKLEKQILTLKRNHQSSSSIKKI